MIQTLQFYTRSNLPTMPLPVLSVKPPEDAGRAVLAPAHLPPGGPGLSLHPARLVRPSSQELHAVSFSLWHGPLCVTTRDLQDPI